MKVIAITNQKGGVGKSTTAAAVGAGLINRGYKTLFIDMDAQGNLTYTIGACIKNTSNVFLALQNTNDIKNMIQKTSEGDILGSTPELAMADNVITQTGKEYRLKEALELIKNNYDYCIVDTPPSLGIVTVNALTACTDVIIPTQADIYSLQGIKQLSNTMEAVKKYCNPDLKIMGIVLTRFNKRSIIRREVAEMLEGIAEGLNTKLFKSRIRECTALVEAQAIQKNIFAYAPKSNATADYNSLLEEILKGR